MWSIFVDSSNAPVKLLEADTLSSGKVLSLDAVLVSIEATIGNNNAITYDVMIDDVIIYDI